MTMLKMLYKPLGLLIGAVFGVVKAALDRGGAAGFREVTGIWPGK
jgi:hypothetical protein